MRAIKAELLRLFSGQLFRNIMISSFLTGLGYVGLTFIVQLILKFETLQQSIPFARLLQADGTMNLGAFRFGTIQEIQNAGLGDYLSWAYSGTAIQFVIAIFVLIYICADFENGNIAFMVSRNISRVMTLVSKTISVMVTVICSNLIYLLTITVISAVVLKDMRLPIGRFVAMIVVQSIVLIAFAFVFEAMAVVIRHVVQLIIASVMGIMAIPMALELVAEIVKLPALNMLWPGMASMQLADNQYAIGVCIGAIVISIIYILVGFALSLVAMKVRDIKA